MDPTCWTGGINLPCKNYDLAKEGALYVKENGQIISSPKTKSCQQTWMYAVNGTCQCGKDIHGVVIYSKSPYQVFILKCNCMTYDDKEGIIVGACPYRCGFSSDRSNPTHLNIYHQLPRDVFTINDVMCAQLNRDGRLCSRCREGFSPLVYSYDYNCTKCTTKSKYNWLKFIPVAFIPLTFFFFIFAFFRINATNPYLYGFITLNQVLASPVVLRAGLTTLKGKYALAMRVTAIPHTIWNLDYFRSLSTEYLSQLVNTTNLSFGLCHRCLPTSSHHHHLCLDRASCQRL